MKQNTEEKKYLLLLNEKEGTMRIAAYPDKDKPDKAKTADPKKASAEEFMVFSGKDAINEFIENYRRQNNYPQGLKWMHAPLKMLDKIGNALFKIKEGDNKALDEFKQYETKPYFKRVYQERDIPTRKLVNLGYSEEYVKDPNTMYALRNGEPLPPMRIKLPTKVGPMDGLFSPRMVTNPSTGKPQLKWEQVQDKSELQKPFMGYSFSEEQQNRLLRDKHLGEVVQLTDPKTGHKIDALISLHPHTNQPYYADTRYINLPDNIKGQPIDKDAIKTGGSIVLKDYESSNGKPLSPRVRYDAVLKKLQFDFSAYRVPQKIGGVDLTAKQQKDYAEGKRVDLGEPKTKDGKSMRPVIYMDENGKMRRDNRTPQEQKQRDTKIARQENKKKTGPKIS